MTLTGPGARLAGDLRLHVPARQPRPAAARPAPRARGAQPRPRVRAPPARVGHPQPGLRRLGLDARRRRARDRPHRRRRSTPRRAGRPGGALRRRARARAWRCSRSARITGDAATAARAAEVLAGSEARLELRARAGRRLGDRGSLRAALELAERCGATALAASRPRRPVRTGAKPRRAALTGAAALTAAQERVARLAAGGLGNRDIAELLFVTEKTVEGHLGAAYRKLGISSRAQLTDALAT